MNTHAYNTTDIHEDAINTYYRRRNRQKKVNKKLLRKQKFFGLGMLALTFVTFFLEDQTAFVFFSMFFVPIGILLIFTKKKVLTID